VNKINELHVGIAQNNKSLDEFISGLGFENNFLLPIDISGGAFASKLISSPGPMVSDFVTHEANFAYGTYGIHVGQDDRLTFMGPQNVMIEGSFVDCRAGSSTLKNCVNISFAPSMARRLVIPRGVAHTFDGLQHVVTRDEPIWHSDFNNPDWNIDNDLISVNRDTAIHDFPIVRANRYRLPDELHVFQSRLSQSLLETPTAYLARYRVTDGNSTKYIMYDAGWGDKEQEELSLLLDQPKISGIEFRPSRYALTGPRSWTIVPSTDSCVADVLMLRAFERNSDRMNILHLRTRMFYTFLNQEGLRMDIAVRDCRPSNNSCTEGVVVNIKIDPRLTVVIEPGIAYSFQCNEAVLVRAEQQVLVDISEPRSDLPIFGQDCIVLTETDNYVTPELPSIECSSKVVPLLARQEIETIAAIL
jgi:hypothetical protein